MVTGLEQNGHRTIEARGRKGEARAHGLSDSRASRGPAGLLIYSSTIEAQPPSPPAWHGFHHLGGPYLEMVAPHHAALPNAPPKRSIERPPCVNVGRTRAVPGNHSLRNAGTFHSFSSVGFLLIRCNSLALPKFPLFSPHRCRGDLFQNLVITRF